MFSLQELNPQQRKVVLHKDGPCLVLAGAGSGKTRCLIYRTAYLIKEEQVKPWQILIVTFTNKAARELRERLDAGFNLQAATMWVGTFHAICTRILREDYFYTAYKSNFTIYDADDQRSLLKKIYKKFNIDAQRFLLNKVHAIISKTKNSLITVDNFFEYHDKNPYTDIVYKIYCEYSKQLTENNAMDFDDLLLNTAKLLHENPQVQEKYAKRFRYVMIDEYQDTNYAQFRIINLIAQKHQNVCVVGDDDQAIYSWRGADIRNILDFEKDYNNVLKVRLEQNYRSTNAILRLANSLIANNTQRHAKQLWSDNRQGAEPVLHISESDAQEAVFVANEIEALQIKYSEVAILYRTNAQSRIFETVFGQKKLPYRIIGGVNFFQRSEIKDILAYLRCLVNERDNESFLRIVNEPPRGIGAKTQTLLINYATEKKLSLRQALFNLDQSLGKGQQAKLLNFKNLLENFLTQKNALPTLVEQLVRKTGLLAKYQDAQDPQDISRLENIREFIAMTKSYAEDNPDNDLEQYLQDISLQTDQDVADDARGKISLLTMHNAKGLEFNVVFVCGLEEELMPHSMSNQSEHELEEERRLLYVAVTRAKEKLFLSYAHIRHRFDGNRITMPSRFLKEMDLKVQKSELYEINAPLPPVKKRTKIFIDGQLHKGQLITHVTYGNGVILNIEGEGSEAVVSVSFKTGELKKIKASYIKPL